MSVKTDNYQVGVSATATQNFTFSTNLDGTMKLARGNAGATTQDILTVDANGVVSLGSAFVPGQQLGQCELSLSGANLILNRLNGSYLFINGLFRQIPSAGVTLPVTGASANTSYYIYASWNGTAIVLSFSATAPTTDTTYGHRIKTGDATMTLVGLARTNVTPSWVDNQGQRFVLSWFNQKPKSINSPMTTNFTTSSTNYVSVSGKLLAEFLHWGNTTIRLNVQGSGSATVANYARIAMELDFSGAPSDPASIIQQAGGSAFNYSFTLVYEDQALSEGYHAASMVTAVDAGTVILNGAASANNSAGRCIITGSVMG